MSAHVTEPSNNGLIINLCPTGMVPRRERVPHVPYLPEEIAADVARCREVGASMVHLHARRDDESPTWEATRFHETVEAVIDAAPDIIVIVTTSGRDWSDYARRSESLGLAGAVKPEMASLTLGSMNFPTSASVNDPTMIRSLATTMRDNGIVPELEVFDIGMADFARELVDDGVITGPRYANILLGNRGTASLSAANVAAVLAALPPATTWALAGMGRHQLAANTLAIALGGHVRVGLEDNPLYDWSAKTPATNSQLVERVVRIAAELGRAPLDPAAARTLIGLDVPARLLPAAMESSR